MLAAMFCALDVRGDTGCCCCAGGTFAARDTEALGVTLMFTPGRTAAPTPGLPAGLPIGLPIGLAIGLAIGLPIGAPMGFAPALAAAMLPAGKAIMPPQRVQRRPSPT